MRRHIDHGDGRIECPACGLTADAVKDAFRAKLIHRESQRIDLRDRLDRERVFCLSHRDHLIIGSDDGDTEHLRVHLGKKRNVVRILPARIALKFCIGFADYGLDLFASRSKGTCLLRQRRERC